jgi:hypothetical protein
MKQRLVFLSLIMVFLPFVSNAVFAGSLFELDDFSSTKRLYPADMNQKMQDISAAVNDNNQKIDSHAGNTNLHHNRYTDDEARTAVGEPGNANALNHDRYTDTQAVSAMGANQADNPLNHDRYTETDAVNAMGSIINVNPLNHDRYTDAESVNAMGLQSATNPLNHSRYTDAEAQAVLAPHINSLHHAPPLMWASIDPWSSAGGSFTAGEQELNTIDIDVPADGFLVIAGMSWAGNSSTTETEDFYLVPYIDGNFALPSGTTSLGGATHFYAPPVTVKSMAYTIVVPVTIGQHTVSQTLFVQDGTASSRYNKNHLTVIYYPQEQGTIVDQSGQPIP